ncbi:cell division protein FtsQ/DivIB [Leptolyngbya iicbica]|uniref:FtsQ-type POTRA domain-containing protein n=2 Tax=Cyanophyceae TaxID=3028117 RepID=A0A4Q7E444_9CYAN|nr:FtsQ-type POTRA domain-containing protein [Leptolyngbya sp. LK]RZM76144.1 FtsQ-type POTRA domain-containing protein [Leptolyngbya sp. LK]
MTNLATPSPEELADRRRSLKRQRRLRNLQHLWRVVAITGLAASAIWLIRNPFWLLLRDQQQVLIDGNEMLSDDAIYQVLGLEYPQRIFDIEPEQLVKRLRTEAPVAYAQVNRQLFPPRVEITLQERIPVAVTVPSRPLANDQSKPSPMHQPGLLDSEGYWIAQSAVVGLNQDFALPTLQVRGFHARYRSQWPRLYEAIQSSPVEIQEIDLRSPNNLIIQTAVGTVHLGIYDARRLSEQLAILPQLSQLTSDPQAPPVDYVDLANPQVPAVKLAEPPTETQTTP